MNFFFRNLDIGWSYEVFYLSKAPCFFYFLTLLNDVSNLFHSSSFLLWLLWYLNPWYWALFLSVLVSNVFATIFSFEQKLILQYLLDVLTPCGRYKYNDYCNLVAYGMYTTWTSWWQRKGLWTLVSLYNFLQKAYFCIKKASEWKSLLKQKEDIA